MKIQDMNENALITSFSSTKRQILILLKREGQMDLSTLSKELNLTKMGVLNHITQLEEMDIVERFKVNIGVGRPRTAFRLAPNSNDIFPKAYSAITCTVLEFVEDRLGRKAVYEALKSRQGEVEKEYQIQLSDLSFEDKIKQLAKIRNQEGYMVELNMLPNSDGFELLEFNCPILNVADRYSEACRVEEELFQSVLDADVATTHRTVANDHVCRFLIRPR